MKLMQASPLSVVTHPAAENHPVSEHLDVQYENPVTDNLGALHLFRTSFFNVPMPQHAAAKPTKPVLCWLGHRLDSFLHLLVPLVGTEAQYEPWCCVRS